MSRDINFNSGYNNCHDKVAILKNETVRTKLRDYAEMTNDDVDINSYVYVDHEVEGRTVPSKMKLSEVIASNAMQSDWDEEDPTKLDYIKNKPYLELTEDLVSLYNVGGLKRGQVIPKGTKILDVLKEIISVTGEAVFRFGVISADEHGALPGDFSIDDLQEFDDKKLADILAYGWSPNPQDCPDLTFDDLGNLILTGSDDQRVFDPTTDQYGTFQGQFFIMAIPKDSNLILDGCFQHGYALGLAKVEFEESWYVYINADDLYLRTRGATFDDDIDDGNGIVEVEDDNIIYQLAPSVGAYKFSYKFKLKD